MFYMWIVYVVRYHRILKRDKHKQLIKELDDLATRNPTAASEKLEQLEHDRIMVCYLNEWENLFCIGTSDTETSNGE